MKTKVRDSNLELLRMISIFMIILVHANMYIPPECGGSLQIFLKGLVNGICNTGVTCFILISGFYGIKFDLKKIIKLECMVITTSLFVLACSQIVIAEPLAGTDLLEEFIKSCFPFITRKYWFYSCYICLVFLSKYIDILLEKLQKRDFLALIVTLVMLFSILPTFFYFEIIQDNGKGLMQMIMIYLIGRYIRLYRDKSLNHKKTLSVILTLWFINGITHEFPLHIGSITHHLCKDNSITNILIAIALFYFFRNLHFYSKSVNAIASYTFIIFIMNNSIIEMLFPRIWTHITTDKVGVIGCFGVMFIAEIIVYMICLLLGMIRKCIFSRFDLWIAEKISFSVEYLYREKIKMKNNIW